MSWIWPDYIHREMPLAAQERKAIRREAWKLWWANKRNFALYVVLAALCIVALIHAADAVGRVAAFFGASGAVYKASRAAGVILTFAASWALLGAVLTRVCFAPCVYRAMRRLGHDICARCGYWLRGLGTDITRCPECGAEREPLPKGHSK